jgi:hypothetical protein
VTEFAGSAEWSVVVVDLVTLCVTDVHCATTRKHDAKIGPKVAR